MRARAPLGVAAAALHEPADVKERGAALFLARRGRTLPHVANNRPDRDRAREERGDDDASDECRRQLAVLRGLVAEVGAREDRWKLERRGHG